MSLVTKIANIEKGLHSLGNHFPGLPFEEMITARLLVHLGRTLSTLSDQALKPYGLVEVEFYVLMTVYGHTINGQMTYPVDLCTRLTQSPANMTRLIDSLVQRELLSRIPDPVDRRKLGLQTTDKAQSLVSTLLPVMFDCTRANFQHMTPDMLGALITTLKTLAGVLDQNKATDVLVAATA